MIIKIFQCSPEGIWTFTSAHKITCEVVVVVNFKYTCLGPTLEILIPRGWDWRLFLKRSTCIAPALRAWDLCSLTGLHASRGPSLSLTLCCSHHEILNNCIINLSSAANFCHSFHIQCSLGPMNTEFQWTQNVWKFSKAET